MIADLESTHFVVKFKDATQYNRVFRDIGPGSSPEPQSLATVKFDPHNRLTCNSSNDVCDRVRAPGGMTLNFVYKVRVPSLVPLAWSSSHQAQYAIPYLLPHR